MPTCNMEKWKVGLCGKPACWTHPRYPTGWFCEYHYRLLHTFFPDQWTFHIEVIAPEFSKSSWYELGYLKTIEQRMEVWVRSDVPWKIDLASGAAGSERLTSRDIEYTPGHPVLLVAYQRSEFPTRFSIRGESEPKAILYVGVKEYDKPGYNESYPATFPFRK